MNIYKGSRNPYGIKVCYKALYLFVPEQNNVHRPHIEVCDLENRKAEGNTFWAHFLPNLRTMRSQKLNKQTKYKPFCTLKNPIISFSNNSLHIFCQPCLVVDILV